MIEQFETALQKKGYQRAPCRPEWIHLYVRGKNSPPDGAFRADSVVAVMDPGQEGVLLPDQVPGIRERLSQIWRLEGREDQILFVLYSEDLENGKAVSRACPGVWLMDKALDRLLLFENQPTDFDGLRALLEKGTERRGAGPSLAEELRWAFLGNRTHLVTSALVLINVGVFLVLSLFGDMESTYYIIRKGGMYPDLVIGQGEWWRLVTCIFLHFGASHLFNNMLILYFLGKQFEEIVGSVRYACIYLLSGISGSILSLVTMLRTGDQAVSAGASGAIFGIMGGLFLVILLHRGRYRGMTMRRMIFMLFLCLYQGYTSAGVDNAGHIGGLAGGLVLTLIMYGIPLLAERTDKERNRD